jgi:hypothetical protein
VVDQMPAETDFEKGLRLGLSGLTS